MPDKPNTELETQVIDTITRLGVDEKVWYESKTIVFNGLSVLLAVAMLLGFGDHVPPAYADEISGALVAVVSAVNIVLRMLTKDPVS